MAKQVHRKAQKSKKNNTLWIWGGLAALIVIGLAVVWFTSQGADGAGSYPREISVDAAVAKRDAGAFILDVRQPEEWNEFHVPDSTLIPLGELASRANELPKDQGQDRQKVSYHNMTAACVRGQDAL